MQLNLKNESTNPNPEYTTDGASGFDIRCSEDGVLKSGEIKAISTGLFFELPTGFEIQVRSRSGLAVKSGVVVLNSPGTIDEDFLGEVKLIMINHSKVDFEYKYGDRLAQGVVASVTAKTKVNFNEVKEFTKETERGNNGFGSTGIN
jgi:dUTP pyrophosphatase